MKIWQYGKFSLSISFCIQCYITRRNLSVEKCRASFALQPLCRIIVPEQSLPNIFFSFSSYTYTNEKGQKSLAFLLSCLLKCSRCYDCKTYVIWFKNPVAFPSGYCGTVAGTVPFVLQTEIRHRHGHHSGLLRLCALLSHRRFSGRQTFPDQKSHLGPGIWTAVLFTAPWHLPCLRQGSGRPHHEPDRNPGGLCHLRSHGGIFELSHVSGQLRNYDTERLPSKFLFIGQVCTYTYCLRWQYVFRRHAPASCRMQRH